MEFVGRPRADAALDERHSLRLVGIEAPAGFGRSFLLHDAIARGPRNPRDRDVLIPCGGPIRTADDLRRAFADARRDRDPTAHLALLLDDVERLDPDGVQVLRDELAAAGEQDHFVLAGRRMPQVGLPGLLAGGRARLLGRDDLAIDRDATGSSVLAADLSPDFDDELLSWPLGWGLSLAGRRDLVPQTLDEIATRDLDAATRRALAAIAAVGGGDRQLVAAVLDAVGMLDSNSSILAALGELPLVEVVDGGCWPHGAWAEATRDELEPATSAAAFAGASDAHRRAARFEQAGALAVECRAADVLARVARDALDSEPPRVSASILERWSASGVLRLDAPELAWLQGSIAAHGRASAADATERLEVARRAYEANGDTDAETAVILHLGSLARREDDLATLGRLLARANDLEPSPRLRALVALGEAIGAQLMGDSAAAVAILDAAPSGVLTGDWAAQEQMVLGTNLGLTGRSDEAVVALSAATGTGSRWVRSVAHDLLSSVRWTRGEVDAAIEDARLAETLAEEAGAFRSLDQIRATARCYLAYAGDHSEPRSVTPARRSGSDEADRLDTLAAIVGLLNAGERDRACEMLERLAPGPNRVVRSTLFRAPLEYALLAERRAEWDEFASRVPALSAAVAAGHAAAEHLQSGQLVDGHHRPFLPSVWCDASGSRVAIRLLGGASVTIDGRPADHPAWKRARVRELCLHLALVEGAGRERVASSLWPNLSDAASAKNLRVTLTYLLDVIDPGRARGQGTDFISEAVGALALALGPRLRIDVVTLVDSATAVIAGCAAGDRLVALSAARRLLGAGYGPVLGGAPVGEWFDPVHRRIDDLVLRAIAAGGAVAFDVGDHELAYQLGARGLEIEPWSERSHELVVGARLATGDLDGARRALQTATAELGELGVKPSRTLLEYMFRAGVRPAVQLTLR